MQITKEEAARAGALTKKVMWTDEELRLVIKVEELVLSFLRGKDSELGLWNSTLSREFETFNDFAKARKMRV